MRAKLVLGAHNINSRVSSLNTNFIQISCGQSCTAEDPSIIVNKPFKELA